MKQKAHSSSNNLQYVGGGDAGSKTLEYDMSMAEVSTLFHCVLHDAF